MVNNPQISSKRSITNHIKSLNIRRSQKIWYWKSLF